MSTLLERALAVRAHKTRKDVNDEQLELALAWLDDHIGMSQLVAALHPGRTQQELGSGCYAWLAIILREAKRRGRITINQNNGPAERRA